MMYSCDPGHHHEVIVLEMTLKIIFSRMGSVRPSALVIDKCQQELEALTQAINEDPHSWILNENGSPPQVACHVLLCWFHAKKAWVKNLLPQVC